MKTKRIMMAVAMTLVCMSCIAQEQRIKEFQTVMSMHETTYKNFIREGKYKEAIAPLTTLINLLDTTNIYKVANISEAVVRRLNAPYYYDLACCYAVTKEKKQALKALEQAVALGYNDYNNMLSIAEVRERMIKDQPLVLCETTTDPDIFWAKPE